MLQHMLVKFVLNKKDMWDELLDTSIYAYNTSVHESSAFTPFELTFGRKAFLPIDIEIDDKGPEELIEQLSKDTGDAQAVQEITGQRLEKLEVAKNNIKKVQEKQKEIFDRKHACRNTFLVGEKVVKKDMIKKKRSGGKIMSVILVHILVPNAMANVSILFKKLLIQVV